LYTRKVTHSVNVIPDDEQGITAGISALNPIHQWWNECLQRGIILEFLGVPWQVESSSGIIKKWCDLELPFRVTHEDLYDAFRKWFSRNNSGQLPSQRQFVIQMNRAFESRSELRKRSSKSVGQKPMWEIKPLLAERQSFSKLYKTVSFDNSEHPLTVQATRPVDHFAGIGNDDQRLSRPIDEVFIEGLERFEHLRPVLDDDVDELIPSTQKLKL